MAPQCDRRITWEFLREMLTGLHQSWDIVVAKVGRSLDDRMKNPFSLICCYPDWPHQTETGHNIRFELRKIGSDPLIVLELKGNQDFVHGTLRESPRQHSRSCSCGLQMHLSVGLPRFLSNFLLDYYVFKKHASYVWRKNVRRLPA